MAEQRVMNPGLIERYLDELDGSLRGSAAVKSDLLAEARDSLNDTVECYVDAGFPPEKAERQALAEFGTVDEVRHGYQTELGLATGVHALRSLALALPLMHILWELTRLTSFGDWSNVPVAMPGWYGPISRTADYTGYVMAALGVLSILLARYLCRRARTLHAGRWLAMVVTAAVGADLVARVVLVTVSGLIDPRLLVLSWSCAAVGFLSMALSVRLVVLARRSWRACVTIVE